MKRRETWFDDQLDLDPARLVFILAAALGRSCGSDCTRSVRALTRDGPKKHADKKG